MPQICITNLGSCPYVSAAPCGCTVEELRHQGTVCTRSTLPKRSLCSGILQRAQASPWISKRERVRRYKQASGTKITGVCRDEPPTPKRLKGRAARAAVALKE